MGTKELEQPWVGRGGGVMRPGEALATLAHYLHGAYVTGVDILL